MKDVEETRDGVEKANVLETYLVGTGDVKVEADIIDDEKGFVRRYFLNFPSYGPGTTALLNNLRSSILGETAIRAERMMEAKFVEKTRQKFRERANRLIEKELPHMPEETRRILIGVLLNEMLGLGKLEILLSDGNLEEIVVNRSKEPVWVYHKKYGWLKTNILMESEPMIENYSSIIARRVGKQITILNPLLDAHLITGDRANATLFPISSKGNTITIRMFRREPWTVTDFINNKTTSKEAMALIWLAMEYELNIITSGGTGSGKTSFLNVCMPFLQPNHRILSIEDTRELNLPEFLHWVPLTTREPNPEGKGGVSMLDLLVNSLRMRPDRIIVGEIRRQAEAEVMFEAMHTGHSVYTTFHANTAAETIRRFTNPPVNVPTTMLEAVHLNVVMFRNRRLGVRRVLQIAEYIPEMRGKQENIKANILYRWRGADDKIVAHGDSIRLFDELSLHTGLSKNEINQELLQKQKVLDWMVKFNVRKVGDVGRVIAQCYRNPEEIMSAVEKGQKPDLKEEEGPGKGEKAEWQAGEGPGGAADIEAGQEKGKAGRKSFNEAFFGKGSAAAKGKGTGEPAKGAAGTGKK